MTHTQTAAKARCLLVPPQLDGYMRTHFSKQIFIHIFWAELSPENHYVRMLTGAPKGAQVDPNRVSCGNFISQAVEVNAKPRGWETRP